MENCSVVKNLGLLAEDVYDNNLFIIGKNVDGYKGLCFKSCG